MVQIGPNGQKALNDSNTPDFTESEGTGVFAGPFNPLDDRPVVTRVRKGAEGINEGTFFLMRPPPLYFNFEIADLIGRGAAAKTPSVGIKQ